MQGINVLGKIKQIVRETFLYHAYIKSNRTNHRRNGEMCKLPAASNINIYSSTNRLQYSNKLLAKEIKDCPTPCWQRF